MYEVRCVPENGYGIPPVQDWTVRRSITDRPLTRPVGNSSDAARSPQPRDQSPRQLELVSVQVSFCSHPSEYVEYRSRGCNSAESPAGDSRS